MRTLLIPTLGLLFCVGCDADPEPKDDGDDLGEGGGVGGESGDGAEGTEGTDGGTGSDGGTGTDRVVWVDQGPDFTVPCEGEAVAQAQVHVDDQACTVCPAGSDVEVVAYVLNPCPDPVSVRYTEGLLVRSSYAVNETTGEDRGGDGAGSGDDLVEVLGPEDYLEDSAGTYRDLSEGVWVFDIGLSADVELEPLEVPFIAD